MRVPPSTRRRLLTAALTVPLVSLGVLLATPAAAAPDAGEIAPAPPAVVIGPTVEEVAAQRAVADRLAAEAGDQEEALEQARQAINDLQAAGDQATRSQESALDSQSWAEAENIRQTLRLQAASRIVDARKGELGRWASQTYRNGGSMGDIEGMMTLLESDNSADLSQRAQMLDMVGRWRGSVVDTVEEAEAVQQDASQKAGVAAEAATIAAAQAETARAQADEALTAQGKEVALLGALQRAKEEDATLAVEKTDQMERTRQEIERARILAEEERVRAEQQRILEEQVRAAAEQARLAALAEQARLAAIAEQARLAALAEQARLVEQARLDEQARLAGSVVDNRAWDKGAWDKEVWDNGAWDNRVVDNRVVGLVGDCKGLPLEGYSNGAISVDALCPVWAAAGHRLRADAAFGFNQLSEAYALEFGAPICVTDSYRSYEGQLSVYANKPDLAAIPGTSNHGWGTATDLCGGIQSFGTPQHLWMRSNAPLYGFFLPTWAQEGGSRQEPWHWEYGT